MLNEAPWKLIFNTTKWVAVREGSEESNNHLCVVQLSSLIDFLFSLWPYYSSVNFFVSFIVSNEINFTSIYLLLNYSSLIISCLYLHTWIWQYVCNNGGTVEILIFSVFRRLLYLHSMHNFGFRSFIPSPGTFWP